MTRRQRHWGELVAAAIVVIGVTIGLTWPQPSLAPIDQQLSTSRLRLGAAAVTVEIAATPAQQAQGLSGRTHLADTAGMLFPFIPQAVPKFWMQDMRFPLDLIWINHDRVLAITPNLSPATYPQTFSPPSAVTAVLEVNAGFAHQHGIKPGTGAVIEP